MTAEGQTLRWTLSCKSRGLQEGFGALRRFTDAYAGKKAKLADAALRNRAGQYVRYARADWSFAGLNVTIPPPSGDWSRFGRP